jgi:hypothetical protein
MASFCEQKEARTLFAWASAVATPLTQASKIFLPLFFYPPPPRPPRTVPRRASRDPLLAGRRSAFITERKGV